MKKQFKAESKRLLDLMINSIYTHKEIFLREIISNASDAIDKLSYRSLTDDTVGMNREDFRIFITADNEARTLTVSDNGIGMTRDELEQNLGVIAKSGSMAFKAEHAGEENSAADTDIIGQFGVGFYSAFMVSDKVTVISKAFGSDTAYKWESEGADGYTVTECEKDGVGTDVIMHIKPDDDNERYGDYLQAWKIMRLVKKYSDYIRWPIQMDIERPEMKETGEKNEDGSPKYETVTTVERETINSQIPIWQRSKSEVTSSISEDAANWLYTEAKPGEAKLFEKDNTFYVLQLTSINDNNYQTVNALQLYIAKDASDKEYKDGEKTSDERVSELEAALKEDSSEEKFREYIKTYADNTSSYTITNGAHRSITPEVARTWLFDSSRKAGDTKEFVDDNGGTYVFFFQDFAETYRDLLVTNKLKTEWYDEVTSAATYTYDADAAKHANLGLTIASIYGSSSSSN